MKRTRPSSARRPLVLLASALLTPWLLAAHSDGCNADKSIGSNDPNPAPALMEVPCGPIDCATDEVCCDDNCGACAADADACPANPCAAPCGVQDACSADETCCLDTCCLPTGEACAPESCAMSNMDMN